MHQRTSLRYQHFAYDDYLQLADLVVVENAGVGDNVIDAVAVVVDAAGADIVVDNVNDDDEDGVPVAVAVIDDVWTAVVVQMYSGNGGALTGAAAVGVVVSYTATAVVLQYSDSAFPYLH